MTEKEKIIAQLERAEKRAESSSEWRKKETLGDRYEVPIVKSPIKNPEINSVFAITFSKAEYSKPLLSIIMKDDKMIFEYEKEKLNEAAMLFLDRVLEFYENRKNKKTTTSDR